MGKIRKYVKQFFERADIFLLVICTISAVYGVFMVHRAVVAMAAGEWLSNPLKFVLVQVFSIVLGLVFFCPDDGDRFRSSGQPVEDSLYH